MRLLSLILVVAACNPTQDVRTARPGALEEEVGEEHADAAFGAASADFDVPVEILQAIAFAETGMQMVTGAEEFEGRPVAWGVMALREDLVEEAAALAGVSADDARVLREANIAAAAALLGAWAEEAGTSRSELEAWAPLVARYSGIAEDNAKAHYVHDEVYAALRAGIQIEGSPGLSWDGVPDYPAPIQLTAGGTAQRSYAKWRASPNHSARPGGTAGGPAMVIIHTCEGAYSGCWSWLTNSSSGVSAHYVVNSDGSEISQLVREDRKAWHISARYDCNLNGGTDCSRNNRSGNDFTVGIEHAGYGSQSSWNPGLLDASARLVCDITRDNGIPRDSYHIVGHGRLQPYNRNDPGPNWPWASYLEAIRAKCGEGGTTPTPVPEEEEEPPITSEPAPPGAATLVIDSNNAVNPASQRGIVVSSNWRSSQSVGGYYNTGYFWRTTGNSADSATFWFQNPSPACYTVEAWWTQGTDRSTQAPFIITNGDGQRLGTVSVNQRQNGGRWNSLGTYAFSAGRATIALSRWVDGGGVVIADAVRLVPSTACAGDTPAAATWEKVIDTSASLNPEGTDVDLPETWTTSAATPGYYGNDYAYRTTGSDSDGVSWFFYLDAPARVQLDARWTAGPNRASQAPYLVVDPGNQVLATVHVDQRANHAAWVGLGVHALPAGWNRVFLSRNTTSGDVVIADAVRVRKLP